MKSKAQIITEDGVLQLIVGSFEEIFINSPALVDRSEATKQLHEETLKALRSLSRPLQAEQVREVLQGYPPGWRDFRPRCHFCGDRVDRVLILTSGMTEGPMCICQGCFKKVDLWESGGMIEIDNRYMDV